MIGQKINPFFISYVLLLSCFPFNDKESLFFSLFPLHRYHDNFICYIEVALVSGVDAYTDTRFWILTNTFIHPFIQQASKG